MSMSPAMCSTAMLPTGPVSMSSSWCHKAANSGSCSAACACARARGGSATTVSCASSVDITGPRFRPPNQTVTGGLRRRGHPIGWIEEAVMLGGGHSPSGFCEKHALCRARRPSGPGPEVERVARASGRQRRWSSWGRSPIVLASTICSRRSLRMTMGCQHSAATGRTSAASSLCSRSAPSALVRRAPDIGTAASADSAAIRSARSTAACAREANVGLISAR
jgi:hypothetical protein